MERSMWNKKGLEFVFMLMKKDDQASFWPRLIRDKFVTQFIQIDWQKWVDEDEEDEAAAPDWNE